MLFLLDEPQFVAFEFRADPQATAVKHDVTRSRSQSLLHHCGSFSMEVNDKAGCSDFCILVRPDQELLPGLMIAHCFQVHGQNADTDLQISGTREALKEDADLADVGGLPNGVRGKSQMVQAATEDGACEAGA